MWLFSSHLPSGAKEHVAEVLERNTWWAKGQEIDEFEAKIGRITGVEYAVAVNSGTSALFADLLARDVRDKEVVVPSFTFPATANAVVGAGGVPKFADIELDTLSLSLESVRKAVSEDTAGVILVHFGGGIARDIRPIREFCDERDIFLLEDAAHSFAARDGETYAGSFGHAGCFSFCFNKLVPLGEGGAVVTDDFEHAQEVRLKRSHGKQDGQYKAWGLNLRLASVLAALGLSQLEELGEMIGDRERKSSVLRDRIEGSSHIRRILPKATAGAVHQLFHILFDSESVREEVESTLEESGIPSRRTYKPVHTYKYHRQFPRVTGGLARTQEAARTGLTVPFHHGLAAEDIERIGETIGRALSN